MADKSENSTVLFAGHAIPTSEAWKRMQTMLDTANHLDRLNQMFSHLATDQTRFCVTEARRHIKGAAVESPAKKAKSAPLEPPARDPTGQLKSVPLEKLAADLVVSKGLDAALDAVQAERGVAIGLQDLVQLIGFKAYEQALVAELSSDEFVKNRLSAQQIAYLWNETERPAPGKPFWDERTVQELMNRTDRGEV
ncbi:MAG: hypothetical protein WCP34_07310 [Pseudomonadota bacterium]